MGGVVDGGGCVALPEEYYIVCAQVTYLAVEARGRMQ